MPVAEQNRSGGREEDGTEAVDLGEKLFNQVTPRSKPATLFPSLTISVSTPRKYAKRWHASIIKM